MGHCANFPDTIASELRAWHTTGLRFAIWGGTGDSASFLQTYGADACRFPIVVDSDQANAGGFVPGTGQLIRSPAWLIENPVDIILIPCRWRPDEIVREIERARIPYEGILIPDEGRLVDFHAAEMTLV